MSIVIPASQLRHTVITVRCESARAAPQIECAFDDQHPPGLTSHTDKGASFSFSSEGRTGAGAVRSSGGPSADAAGERRDLSIERGQDTRGHFVRLSFSPPPRMMPMPGPSRLAPNSEQQVTSPGRQSTPRQATPFQQPLKYDPPSWDFSNMTQLANDSYPQLQPGEMMGFPLSSDDLLSAFDTSLDGLDYTQNCLDYLMAQAPDAAGGMFDQTATSLSAGMVPVTPDMSASSSASSAMSSPPTPHDFGIASASASASGMSLHSSPATSLEPSPMTPASALPQHAQLHALALSSTPGAGPSGASESRLLPCPHPGCKRQFKNTSTLTGHLKTHAGKGARFACSFPPCAEKFSRRHDQLRHEVYKHGKRCEWVCTRCNSFFSYERSLEKHQCTMDKSRRGSVPFGDVAMAMAPPPPPPTAATAGTST